VFNWPILIAVGASCLLVGVAVGALLSRLFTPETRNYRELERRLVETGASIKNYRQDVSDHYVKTANLVDELTESYRELHNHLAEGAGRLLDTRGVEPLMRSIPSRERIDAIADATSAPILPPLDYAPKSSPTEKGVLDESFDLDSQRHASQRLIDPLQDFFTTPQPTANKRKKERREFSRG